MYTRRDELAGLIATMAMRLQTVELVVPLAEITRRVGTYPTAGRQDDLAELVAWAEDGGGVGVADYTVETVVPFARSLLTSFGGRRGLPTQASDIAPICR